MDEHGDVAPLAEAAEHVEPAHVRQAQIEDDRVGPGHGGFIEADYNPTALPKWLFIYRYDWITNSHQPDSTLVGNFNNLQGHTVAIRYNFMFTNRTDIALHLEYNHLSDRGTAASLGDQHQNTMLVGFDFAL